MRKIYLFLLCALVSISATAQKFEKYSEEEIQLRFEEMKKNFKDNNGEWIFERIVEVNSSKDDIYKAAIESLSNTYEDAKDVIESEDKEAGRIIAKGKIISKYRPFNGMWNIRNIVEQSVKIDIKDNRYRITLKFDRLSYQTDNINEGLLTNFYPYATGIKDKFKSRSFEHLETAYELAVLMMDNIQLKIKESLQNDEW